MKHSFLITVNKTRLNAYEYRCILEDLLQEIKSNGEEHSIEHRGSKEDDK